MVDKNEIELSDGDIIDIHQTVNGQNLFVVYINEEGEYSVTYLNGRTYEYDVMELLENSEMFSDEKTIEIIGNIKNGSAE
jgi:phage terminase large subunit